MSRERYNPDGKVIFVTGAARGIGLAAAKRLAARGANVALVGLEPELLEREAAAIGPKAAWFHADVTDRTALRAAAAGTIERFGGIDVVIANAGLSPIGTIRTLPDSEFDRTIAVNLTGVWNTLRAGLDSVIERQGYLLTVSSLSAALPAPIMGAYTASKAAVDNMTRTLHCEIAHTGARAGVAYFGFIDTDLVRHTGTHPASQASHDSQPAFLRNPVPLSKAVNAIERGVDRRALTVVAPGWVRAALALRGVTHSAIAKSAQRPEVVEAIRLAEDQPWKANDPTDARREHDTTPVA